MTAAIATDTRQQLADYASQLTDCGIPVTHLQVAGKSIKSGKAHPPYVTLQPTEPPHAMLVACAGDHRYGVTRDGDIFYAPSLSAAIKYLRRHGILWPMPCQRQSQPALL